MLIGVTGNIGSGKSTFCKFLELKGFKVISGDELAKNFLQKEKEKVVKTFGREVLTKKGEIDKKRLAQIVFSDREKLEKLTSIIHPLMVEELKRLKEKEETVFFEAAVIVEYGWQNLFDGIVTVFAYKGQRILRAAKRFGLKETLRRENMQLPYSEKLKYTDFLICNTKNLFHLKAQCENLIENLIKQGI